MEPDPGHRYEPTHFVHPGEFILDELEERGMSQAQLARLTGLSNKHINLLVRGRVSLTAETAVKIERAWGVRIAHVLMRLQADYDVWRQREAS